MTKNTPLVSIIVPVYNVEKFVAQCIESAISQSFTDFELIIIDDGSQDNSYAICEKYAAKDDRIKILRTENKGVSATRLLGAKIAKGKWLSFLDSDDELTKDSIQHFVNASKKTNAKIIKGAYKYIYDKENKETIFNDFDENEVSFFNFFTKYRSFNIWSAFIDRELFISLQHPPVELKMGEDRVLIYQAAAISNKIFNIPHLTYIYKQNQNSVVSTYVNHYRCRINFKAYIETFDKTIISNKKIKLLNRELIKRDCIYMIYLFLGECTTEQDKIFGEKYLTKYLYNNPIQLSIDFLSKVKKLYKNRI